MAVSDADSASARRRETSWGGLGPWLLLALSSLLWAGNWVASRGIRETMPPIALNFWRWAPVILILAPLALPRLKGKGALIRRRLGILTLLGATGVTFFTSFVYLGLQTTTAVNAVLLNSSMPLFMILCSWAIERETATLRQIAGMLVSFAGILIIMVRGDPAGLLRLQFHIGDAWILGAMPFWGLYSVLLKRRPRELDGIELLFLVAIAGLVLLAPFYLAETVLVRPAKLTVGSAATVLYLSVFASVIAYFAWNRGVAAVGANRAGFTIHLLPAFGTILAVIFLGEHVRLYHFVGIATILAGVWLATSARRGRLKP
jgi:drug/metabolite transporter (DMT)-like permease